MEKPHIETKDVKRHQSGQKFHSDAPQPLWTKDFVVITTINLLLFISWQLFPSTLPLYIKELGVPDSLLGLVQGLATVSALIVRPITGALLDRYGRKGIFAVGLLLMIVVSLSYAFFPIAGIILLIRLVHGIGWGVSSTAVSTIATDVIPKRRFGEGIGFFSLAASVALAIAPGVGIGIFSSIGMEVVVYCATVAATVAFLLSFVVNTPREVPKKDTRTKTKMVEKAALIPSVVVFFVTATYGAITTFIALFALERGVEGIGLFFTVFAIILIISRPLAGKIVDRKGTSVLIAPSLIILLAALIFLVFADSLPLFLVCSAMYGLGYGGLQSALQTLAIAFAPVNRRGAANATYFVGFDAGIGVGSVVSGLIAGIVGYTGMFAVIAFFPLISFGIYLLYRSQVRAADKGQEP